MKKQAILMLLTCFMLVGCSQRDNNNQSDVSSSTTEMTEASAKGKKTSESKESVSSSSNQETNSSMETADKLRKDELSYSSTLEKLQADQSEGHATLYAFYDIDQNGTPELLTGHMSTNGDYYLTAIYYLNQGVSTYLAQSKVAQVGGSREGATIYTDGTVFYARWHALRPEAEGYMYRLRSDNTGFDIEKEGEFHILGVESDDERSVDSVFGLNSKTPIDLASLTWKDISSYSPSY